MKNPLLKLAELLPDNLSEETLSNIIGLIQETIKSEVSERMKVLEAKASAFIRKNIDSLKIQAESELVEENELYQDAMQFRKLKSIMGINEAQVTESKETKDITELQSENKVLYEHLDSLAGEVAKYKKIAKSYKQKALLAEQAINEASTEIQDLKDSSVKPFKSSEKALVVTESNEINNGFSVTNPFLSDEVVALMPKG